MGKGTKWLIICLLCIIPAFGVWVVQSQAQDDEDPEAEVEEFMDDDVIFEDLEDISGMSEAAEETDDYIEKIQAIMEEPRDVIVLAISEIRTICEITNTMEKLPEILKELFADCKDLTVRNAAYVGIAEAYISTEQYDKAVEAYKNLIKENLAAIGEEKK
jgi:hypothetical protein